MATQTIAIEEAGNHYGTWSHVFVAQNTGWLGFDERQFLGNFFLGLQAQAQNIWNAQIPEGAEILNATVEFLPFQNNGNLAYTTQINTPNRNAQTFIQDPIQLPFENWTGYRQDQWSTASCSALSTTFTTVFATSATINASWIMRQISAVGSSIDHRDHMAQLVTTRTGNMTIASQLWELDRVGNPTGDLTVRIQGVTTDRGVKIPDGIDVAVSNPVAASSIGTTVGFIPFTFPGTVTLAPTTEYFILIEPEYSANNADYIRVHHEQAFLGAGGLLHYGEGLAMDWQNYPGVVDLNQAFALGQDLSLDTAWVINSVVTGVVETSPDITALVQAQVNAPNYTQDAGIILQYAKHVPTAQNRIMSANSHASNAGPILRVTYRDRRINIC